MSDATAGTAAAMPRYTAQRLETVARDLIAAAGSPPEEAARVAGLLVAANLAGHDSHGVIRIPQYLGLMRRGLITPGQRPRVLLDRGAAVRLSGGYGYGQIAASEAAALAVERARTHRVAAVGVSEMNHMGRLVDHVLEAAEAGQIGLLFAASGGFNKLVAPFGGAERRLNTNPVAAAFPGRRDAPVAFDISTSAYAQGKFRHLLDARQPVPEGVLIDAEGRPATDPQALYDGGAILPLGGAQGYKGYLLNFMIEVLAGILTEGGYMGAPRREAGGNCMLMVCLDVDAFRPLADFRHDLAGLIAHLKATRPQPGAEVLYPGERATRTEAERRREGIPLPADTVKALQAELERYGLADALGRGGRDA